MDEGSPHVLKRRSMAGETRHLIRSIRRVTGIRLTVFLPLFLMGLVVAVGLWGIRLAAIRVGRAPLAQLALDQSQGLREAAFWVIGIGGGLALLMGLLLALAIRRPITTLLERTERMVPGAVPRLPLKKIDELSSLSNSMNHLLLSFEKYVRISDVFDRLPEAIVALSRDGEILSANAEAQRLLGAAGEELVGRRLPDLLEPTREENSLLLSLLRTTVDRTPTTFAHLRLGRSDGTRVEVRGGLSLADSAGGDELLLTVQDLAHARTIQGEVRRVDQLAALGALGATIIHEIGGAVQTIQTLVDLIAPEIPAGSDEARYVEKIQAELDRVRRLADEIRTLAQVEIRERVPCVVETLLADALWTAETRYRDKGISVTKRLPALPVLAGDPERLNRAFLNILINAFEATPPGGRLSLDAIEEKAPADLGGGNVVVVRVVNSGSYIPPADLERVFDLFFTTKKEGSGLGLPVAVRAVADHGGKITVQSSRQDGTEFALFLPVEDVGSRP